jgi:hypothetical protein
MAISTKTAVITYDGQTTELETLWDSPAPITISRVEILQKAKDFINTNLT